jgi:hypothetical protein
MREAHSSGYSLRESLSLGSADSEVRLFSPVWICGGILRICPLLLPCRTRVSVLRKSLIMDLELDL